MFKSFKKIATHGMSNRILMAVFVLAAVDMFSMTAPYYLKYVVPHIYTYLHISQADFDQLGAVLGYTTLLFMIPSGIVADKLSGKKVLMISSIMTGILTIIFGLACQSFFAPNIAMPILYLVFIGFGVSTTLFLWSPLWKVLSNQGSIKQQGSLYGLQGSYNGLLGLLFITLIGTIATNMAANNNNSLFYILIYIIATALFLSAIGIYFFIEDKNRKSQLILKFKNLIKQVRNIKFKRKETNNFNPVKVLRIWLLAFFLLGLYMFQSIFAYYLKDYLAIIVPATIVAIFAGARTYGLRLIISGPFGKWLQKRKSWVFTLAMVLSIGLLSAITVVLIAGFGNNINALTSKKYILALQIISPILFLLIGAMSWFLVVGRYMQIEEVPNTKSTYGTIVSILSLIAFSSDAWFYQMASSWMKGAGHVMTAADVVRLGYGEVGGYDQAGLQLILFVAIAIALFGLICGLSVFLINKHEIKKLNKSSYRWRSLENK